MATSSRSDRDRKGGGPPLGLLGLAVLVALVAAYLGDCIPGMGAGSSVGVPSSEAPSPAEDPSQREGADGAGKSRLTIAVVGERCETGSNSAPCAEVCAGLGSSGTGRTTIEIDASRGAHGTVEDLRACLEDAGFTDVRVRSE